MCVDSGGSGGSGGTGGGSGGGSGTGVGAGGGQDAKQPAKWRVAVASKGDRLIGQLLSDSGEELVAFTSTALFYADERSLRAESLSKITKVASGSFGSLQVMFEASPPLVIVSHLFPMEELGMFFSQLSQYTPRTLPERVADPPSTPHRNTPQSSAPSSSTSTLTLGDEEEDPFEAIQRRKRTLTELATRAGSKVISEVHGDMHSLAVSASHITSVGADGHTRHEALRNIRRLKSMPTGDLRLSLRGEGDPLTVSVTEFSLNELSAFFSALQQAVSRAKGPELEAKDAREMAEEDKEESLRIRKELEKKKQMKAAGNIVNAPLAHETQQEQLARLRAEKVAVALGDRPLEGSVDNDREVMAITSSHFVYVNDYTVRKEELLKVDRVVSGSGGNLNIVFFETPIITVNVSSYDFERLQEFFGVLHEHQARAKEAKRLNDEREKREEEEREKEKLAAKQQEEQEKAFAIEADRVKRERERHQKLFSEGVELSGDTVFIEAPSSTLAITSDRFFWVFDDSNRKLEIVDLLDIVKVGMVGDTQDAQLVLKNREPLPILQRDIAFDAVSRFFEVLSLREEQRQRDLRDQQYLEFEAEKERADAEARMEALAEERKAAEVVRAKEQRKIDRKSKAVELADGGDLLAVVEGEECLLALSKTHIIALLPSSQDPTLVSLSSIARMSTDSSGSLVILVSDGEGGVREALTLSSTLFSMETLGPFFDAMMKAQMG